MKFGQITSMHELKPGDHWIGVTNGMSGWFAVEVWLNPEMGGFVEPWDTGIGRYKTKACAEDEAWAWAQNEDLPYDLPGYSPLGRPPITTPRTDAP